MAPQTPEPAAADINSLVATHQPLIDRRHMMALVCGGMGASLAAVSFIADGVVDGGLGATRPGAAPTEQSGVDPAHATVLGMLGWSDERLAKSSKLFAGRASVFASDERLIEGCRRLVRIAGQGRGPDIAERDRIMISALWGLHWLGAEEDAARTAALVRERADLPEATTWIRRNVPTPSARAREARR